MRMPLLLCLLLAPLAAGAQGGTAVLGTVDDRPGVEVEGQPLLALDPLWVADGGWQAVYRPPAPARTPGERVHEGEHGRVVERVRVDDDGITLRYEFDFRPLPDAAHLQWVLRLEPDRFDGAIVRTSNGAITGPRPLAGLHAGDFDLVELILPTADVTCRVASSDGDWRLSDQREAAWARCYRLEWNRDFTVDGGRSGWVELRVAARSAAAALVPLSSGEAWPVRGLPFRLGPLAGRVETPISAFVLLHTAERPVAPGEVVGRVTLRGADGEPRVRELRYDRDVNAAGDDPRDLPGGARVELPDGGPAWLSVWPLPDVTVPAELIVESVGPWRPLAVLGLGPTASELRRAALQAVVAGGEPVTDELAVSLDGAWELTPAGGAPREVTVPSRWDQLDGLRGVNEAVYRRSFDVPAAMSGQRILLRCDAIGEYAEVTVNGHPVGRALAGPLPVKFDLTERVATPSTDNELVIRVQDDTHFALPRASEEPWRAYRHWIPHGIGGGNRKGLFQSVTLRGRPPVQIASARIQTSVRRRELTVVYELFNPRRETLEVRVGGSVHPAEGGAAELTLPQTAVELPGQVTTTATLTVPWPEPRLWQPNHPHLYTLRSLLSDAEGKRLHRRDDRFGFREVWFEGIAFHLNGIRCNLRGESPSYAQRPQGWATREQAIESVRRSLDAGFNVLRFHAAPAPPHVLEVCDELGMLVIDESAIYASWGMVAPEHPRWLDECRSHLERLVRRDRNHPSVVLWSAENEGLNVGRLSPAQLAEFAAVMNEHDGTRPVIFDGDGSAFGASPASVKHYVATVDDLRDLGGKSSGYGRDLRNDIYWAAAYEQPLPLGIGEFLFPANDAMRERHVEVCAMMGLQTRGYRYADWFDIRPYNPFYTGYQEPGGVREGYEAAWDLIRKSFAAVAVFDYAYDERGAFPTPPKLPLGRPVERRLVVYNDCFEDEQVTVRWRAVQNGEAVAGGELPLTIPLGEHLEPTITFTPRTAGPLELHLESYKGGQRQFEDVRAFVVE